VELLRWWDDPHQMGRWQQWYWHQIPQQTQRQLGESLEDENFPFANRSSDFAKTVEIKLVKPRDGVVGGEEGGRYLFSHVDFNFSFS
jgi:hypothetical protein